LVFKINGVRGERKNIEEREKNIKKLDVRGSGGVDGVALAPTIYITPIYIYICIKKIS
jgi:hypothetical protein